MDPYLKALAIVEDVKQNIRDTKPADRPKVEEAIAKLYQLKGLEPPKEYKWFFSGKGARDWLLDGFITTSDVDSRLPSYFGIPHCYWSDRVGQAAWSAPTTASLAHAVNGCFSDRVEGATINFFEMASDDDGVGIILSRVLEEVTCWWAYANVAIIVDRPKELHLTDSGMPHRLDGPSIIWRDEHKDYHIRGCRVPAHLIEDPSKITVQEIKALGNFIELRRIYIERMGLKRFLAESSTELLDMDGGLPGPGGAPRALVRDCFGSSYLIGTDGSTSRVYFMSVNPAAKTCKRAHEEISGLVDETIIKYEG